MFYYLCKLALKMLTEWKKEMLLIMAGTAICSCAVIKFTDNITNFEHFYYDAKGTKEEQIFYENRVHFSFPDAEKLPEAVERLKGMEGIRNVILKGNCEIAPGHDFKVAFYSDIPILTEHDNSIGKMPEQVEDGTIVLSFQELVSLEGGMPVPEEGIVEIQEEDSWQTKYTVFYSCDKKFPMAGRTYQVVAENFFFSENLLSLNDFMGLDKDGKLSGVELVYIYDDSFSDRQMAEAEEQIRAVRKWVNTYKEQPQNTLEVSDYLDLMGKSVIGVVLAVLNALFIYRSVLKRRLPSYSVLKLLGLGNIRLRVMILMEMLLVFVVSYLIAFGLFLCYCGITGELVYNLRYSAGYSFGLLLAVYILLSLVMTGKLVRKQPFEMYAAGR